MFKNWRNALIITLVFLILTLAFTLARPLKYRSSSRLLVMQDYSAQSEPDAASKSAQYLSNIFSEVVYSSSFFNEAMSSDFNIDKNYFNKNDEKRQKQWNKMISAKAISDTGIIDIDVYHTNKEQADQISQAIGYILKTKHNLYHGGGDKVSVMIIDKPITSNWPVRPNILVNLILALVFGLCAGMAFLYYFPGYNLDSSFARLWRRKKQKTIFHNHLENDVREEYLLHKAQGEFTKEDELEDL